MLLELPTLVAPSIISLIVIVAPMVPTLQEVQGLTHEWVIIMLRSLARHHQQIFLQQAMRSSDWYLPGMVEGLSLEVRELMLLNVVITVTDADANIRTDTVPTKADAD